MENASKALIIAGAILISILLISIGIIILNSINAPIEQSQDEATQQATQMFNSKFASYAGVQNAAAIRTLCTAIITSNGTNADRQITVLDSFEDTLQMIQARASNQRKYLVVFGNDTAGYINTVTITVEAPVTP